MSEVGSDLLGRLVTTPDEPKTYRCRAGTETARCSYRGTRDELRDHADEMGHPRCIVPQGRDRNGEPRTCGAALTWHEKQSCDKCVANVRDDLTAIAGALTHLERVIDDGAYRGILWNAVTMSGDGSIDGGGEDDHVRYHDPLPPVAVLETWDRDWRETFGHTRPAYKHLGHPDRLAQQVLAECFAYLTDTHLQAARTHPGFDDYALDIQDLRSRLEHVVGLADDPAKGAPCGCGALLRRDYGQDDWTCPDCGTVTTRSEYLWRLRLASHVPGFVSVAEAARDVGRPMRTVQTWARLAEVPVICIRVTRRVVVELAGVRARSEEVAHRERRAS